MGKIYGIHLATNCKFVIFVNICGLFFISVFLFDLIRYEIGNYLGGGVAGVVYECERTTNLQHFALKILNPVGYKLERKAALKQVWIK